MNLPEFLNTTSIQLGINITFNSVWVIGLDRHKKIVFHNSTSCKTSFFQGDKVDIEVLSEALKTVMVGYAGPRSQAAICFPERLAYSRERAIPKLSFHEITEAITWQLPSIFPLEQKEIYIDWKLLSETETEMKVVVVAVGKTLLDGLQASCLNCGIRPFSFEPSASTLARALENPLQTHIILEVDSFGTSASLIQNSISSLTTTTTFSVSDSIESIIKNVSNSLTNLISHIAQEETNKIIPPVYLTGEKATLKLADLISADTHFKVSLLPLPVESPGLHVPYIASFSTLLPPESEKSINLLPPDLRELYRLESNIRASKTSLKYGLIGSFICLVTAICLLLISVVMNQKLTRQILTTTVPAPIQSTVNIPLTLSKAAIISQLSSQKFVPTEALDALNQAGIFNGATRKLFYDASTKQIQLTVAKEDRETLYSLKENLEQTGKFVSITVPLSVFGSTVAEDSTLTLTLK